MTQKAGGIGTKDVEIMVPLKYLGNLWRTLEIPLINCQIILQVITSTNCFFVSSTVSNQEPKFIKNYTKLIFHSQLYQLKIIQKCSSY